MSVTAATTPAARPTPTGEAADAVSLLCLALGIATLALVVIRIVVSGDPDGLHLTPQLYTAANVFLYLSVILGSSYGMISILTSFFFLFFVAIPAQVQVAAHTFPFGHYYNGMELAKGYEILAVGQLALMLGNLLARTHAKGSASPSHHPVSGEVCRRYLWAISLICLGIVARLGISTVTHSRFAQGGPGLASSSGGPLLAAGRSMSLFAVLLCVLLWRREERRGRSSLVPVTLVTGLGFLLLNYPTSLPRFQLLGIVVALGCLSPRPSRRTVERLTAFLGPVFMLFLFPASKAIGTGHPSQLFKAVTSNVHQYLLSADFDGFKQTVDTWIYTQNHPLRDGQNFLGVVLFWVPRGIWPAKPVHTGEVVSSALGYPFNNVSNPLPAEGYVSWRLIGTVCAMALLGYLCRSVERSCGDVSPSASLNLTPILEALVAAFVIIILRGALDAIVPMVAPAFVLYALLWMQSRRRAAPGPQPRLRPKREVRVPLIAGRVDDVD